MPPQIDLSIVLTDPDLLDSVQVQRRQETVGTNGRNTLATTTFNNIPAIVHVTGDNNLQRPPEGERQSKQIDVYTRFALRGASVDSSQVNWQPDLVIWNGDTYIVDRFEDWSNYAEGWIVAHCIQTDMVSAPPTTHGRIGP